VCVRAVPVVSVRSRLLNFATRPDRLYILDLCVSYTTTDDAMSNDASLNNEVVPVVAETIAFTPDQQTVYQAAARVLSEPPVEFLAPIPKIVSVELLDLADSTPVATGTTSTTSNSDQDLVTLLTTPTRGHHELYRALEGLEGLEKDEASLASRAPLVRELTQLVTTGSSSRMMAVVGAAPLYRDAAHALQSLEQLGQAVPRRVCQHPFKKNDIVWVCRTCQADETCVLCHACYSQSDHVGHDVAFYHAQAGGCCDCGDPDGTYNVIYNRAHFARTYDF
jgi:Putative zinc finger in N-recognin (UBR box)